MNYLNHAKLAMLSLFPQGRRAVHQLLETENAAQKLTMVARPEMVLFLMSEVERRRLWFEKVHRETPCASQETPQKRALESVYHDVIRGAV